MALDGTLFIDGKGDPWLVYCHEWVQVTNGTIKAVRLSEDLSRIVGEPRVLLSAGDVSWTKRTLNYRNTGDRPGIVTDGPWIHRNPDGSLALLWSSWTPDRDYATAVAFSRSGELSGPWEHEPSPRLLDDRGHGALFRGFDGKLRLIVHRYFRQPATRVQIFDLEETSSGFRILGQSLGSP
jgi:hypothetical protein